MRCTEVYEQFYHRPPEAVAFCPYRVSPLGAHIDHQFGKINGLAIDKGIHIAYRPKKNGVIELQSLNFPKRAQFHVNAVPERKEGDWADHLRGATKMLGEVPAACGHFRCDRGQSSNWRSFFFRSGDYLFPICPVQGQ